MPDAGCLLVAAADVRLAGGQNTRGSGKSMKNGCHMLPPRTPVQQTGVVLAHSHPAVSEGHRVGLHMSFRMLGGHSLAARTLVRSPIRDLPSKAFRHFASSIPAPVASGWLSERLRYGRIDQRAQVAAQGKAGLAADDLRHEHDRQLFLRVDPEGGGGGAAPGIGAERRYANFGCSR